MTDTNDAAAGHAPRGEHEIRYLAEVEHRLGHVPPGRRRELLSVAADNLDERPPATSWAELEQVLGAPADYATELLDGSVPTPGRSKAEARRVRRRRWQIAGITAVVLAACGAGALWWQRANDVPDVELQNNCFRPSTTDPRVTIDSNEAAGLHEARIGYVHDSTFTMLVCLSASHDIEILDIDLWAGAEDEPKVLSELVRVGARRVGPEGSTERPDPLPTWDPPVHLGTDNSLEVELDNRFVHCSRYAAGARTSFDTVEVTYRVKGRERTAMVGTWMTYTVVSPSDDDCPLARRSNDGD